MEVSIYTTETSVGEGNSINISQTYQCRNDKNCQIKKLKKKIETIGSCKSEFIKTQQPTRKVDSMRPSE